MAAAIALAVLLVLAAVLAAYGAFLVAGLGWALIATGVLVALFALMFLAEWGEPK
ncbi:hypothetical protein [Saccharopolyspora mangrovi]|uniref:DUF2207 domain-containing protein n=1 Tax=Saccharopolyspora mangrovi TaxID=3082379 RepID=A0ABU6A7A2_9PSEU|nr:hypothetical protein [Saccharopolyspora sp. S2-29]MEB3367408.1 hypothetical protein [Saccharopolyspora sp. S2-29]